MFIKLMFIVQVCSQVMCEPHNPRGYFQDYNKQSDTFYTHFGNELKDDQGIVGGGYKRPTLVEDSSSYSLEDNVYKDRVDFHYPQVEFLTKDEIKSDSGEFQPPFDHYNFQQNHDGIEYQRGTRKPRLKIHSVNTPEYEYTPIKLSYVQKIPKPSTGFDSNENTRYEEMSTESSSNITKSRIDMLLKKYLAKLYSQRFDDDSKNHERPSDGALDVEKNIPADTKYLDDSLWSVKSQKIHKIKKLFSLFTIVQFNNTQCNATGSSGSYLGVCYTSQECANLGGTAVGNCASGYGVCCVFRATCGDFVSQNCSYFESPNYPDYYPPGSGVIIPTTIAPPSPTTNPSPTPDPRFPWNFYRVDSSSRQVDNTLSCTLSVYKINSNVSKMKIDFLDLELTGPTNGTCRNERLVISGQNMNDIIPAICGYNTGQSIYVDVSTMSGPLQLMVLSDGSYRKRFRFRICQYTNSCSEPNSNCLQYYTGVTGTISSFNYDQASTFNRSVPGYFNNLNYAICIRREAGYCSITYTNVRNRVEYPFELRNVDDGVSTVPRGTAGVDTIDCPDDYIVIMGTRLCGYKLNDGSNADITMNVPLTDTSAGPIVIPVRTNSAVTGLGFKLFYTQNRCSTM